ncbi:MAG TPA: YafY family protein [bacterium]
MARSERLLALIQLLRRYRNPVTAARLAEELDVSPRSVYRDIETLRSQGAVIAGEAGVGYLLQPGFFLPPLMFQDEELEAIVLGLRLAAEHGDDGLGRAATDVMAKLRAVLPRDLRVAVDEAGLLAGPRRQRADEAVDAQEVRRTLREARKAEIDYARERGAPTTRVIWPIGLAYFSEVRLVVAWCELRRDFRAFRLDRIARWRTLPDPLPKPRLVLLREWREQEGIKDSFATGE